MGCSKHRLSFELFIKLQRNDLGDLNVDVSCIFDCLTVSGVGDSVIELRVCRMVRSGDGGVVMQMNVDCVNRMRGI